MVLQLALKDGREKILTAAVDQIRKEGFAASSVDKLCRQAGVTKGAFFHHFDNKADMGAALADFWGTCTAPLFETAPYQHEETGLARLMGYVDFRMALLDGPLESISCVAGTLVQETFLAEPDIRDACGRAIFGHVANLVPFIEDAIAETGAELPDHLTPESLAAHIQGVLQGAFIMAKAGNDIAIARAGLGHLRHYLTLLFH